MPVSCVLRQNVLAILTGGWQHINAFSLCVTLRHVLLSEIISYSDSKVPVLVLMEYKCASVSYVYKFIFLLHTSRSTENRFWILPLVAGIYKPIPALTDILIPSSFKPL